MDEISVEVRTKGSMKWVDIFSIEFIKEDLDGFKQTIYNLDTLEKKINWALQLIIDTAKNPDISDKITKVRFKQNKTGFVGCSNLDVSLVGNKVCFRGDNEIDLTE